MSDLLHVTFGHGKYTIIQAEQGGMRFLRNGVTWDAANRDWVHCGMILAMAQEIEALRERLAGLDGGDDVPLRLPRTETKREQLRSLDIGTHVGPNTLELDDLDDNEATITTPDNTLGLSVDQTRKAVRWLLRWLHAMESTHG